MGWDGENSSADTIKQWDGTAYREIDTPVSVPSGGTAGEVVTQSSTVATGILSFPRNVITTDGTDLLISCGPTIAPATSGGAPDAPGVAYAADGIYWKAYAYPDAGYSVSCVLYAGGNIWAVVEDRTTRDLWWHEITIVDGDIVWTGSRSSMERPGSGQQTTFLNGYASGTRIYISFSDANGRLIRYDATTSPPTPVVNSPDALTFGIGPDATMVHDGSLGRLYHCGASGLAVFDEDALTYVGSLHWGYDSEPYPTIAGIDTSTPFYGFATDGTRAYFVATNNNNSNLVFFNVDATDLVSSPSYAETSPGIPQGMTADLPNDYVTVTSNESGTATTYGFTPSFLGGYSSNNFPVDGVQSGYVVAQDVTQKAMASFVAGKHLYLTNAAPYGGPPYSYHAYYVPTGTLLFSELISYPGLTWAPSDEALMEVYLPPDIHVDKDTGSDDNDGLTSGTALETLGEARRRIGDKNGDVTIWLWGAIGTVYSIDYNDPVDKLWNVPRKGYGKLTIRSEVVETVATVTATAYDNQIFLISTSPAPEEYDGNFVALGSALPMANGSDPIILHSTTGFSGMIWISDTAAMPSPDTLTIWRPGIGLYLSTPNAFHCGSEDGNVVELINLSFSPGVVSGGGLTMKWVHVSGTQYWTNVAFKDCSRIYFSGSPYFERCTTHQATSSFSALQSCVFQNPEFYGCGFGGIDGTFSQGSPFQIWNARMYVTDIHSSEMVLNYIVCTGNVLGEVYNSTIYMQARPIQYRNISLLSNTRMELEIDDLPSIAMGIYSGSTAFAYVYVMRDSRLTITWNNNPNPTLFGLPLLENSHVRVNKDISQSVGVPQLSFSNATDGYLLPDGSFIGRENSSSQASMVGRNSAGGYYTNYVASVGPVDRQDHYGPILDGDAGTYSFTFPVNREFNVKVLITAADNASPTVRYALSYLVKGSTDYSGIVTYSDVLQWSATDDDLTDDPLTELAVTFGSSSYDLQVTVANNIGGNTRLSASVYFEPEHYTVQQPPDPPLTPSSLASYGTMTYLYDFSGIDTTVPDQWDPNIGGPNFPVIQLSSSGGFGIYTASLAAITGPLGSPLTGTQSFVAVGQFPSSFTGTNVMFSMTIGNTSGPVIDAPFAVVSGDLVAITSSGSVTLITLNPTYADLPFAVALRLVSGDWYLSLRCGGNHDTASGADSFSSSSNLDTITLGAMGDLSNAWGTYMALAGGYSTAHIDGDIELISAEAATAYGI